MLQKQAELGVSRCNQVLQRTLGLLPALGHWNVLVTVIYNFELINYSEVIFDISLPAHLLYTHLHSLG